MSEQGSETPLPAPTAEPRPKKLQRLLYLLGEELDGAVLILGALAIGAAEAFSLQYLLAGGVAAVVLGAGLRIFRVRYQLNDLETKLAKRVAAAEQGLSDRVTQVERSVTDEARTIEASVSALRSTVVSDLMHEAERCNRTKFYLHMLEALRAATESVDLTQLDAQAPSNYGTPEMLEYFALQAAFVRDKPHLRFRRIVAVPTLAKLDWLLGVIEATRTCSNFQINVIDISKSGELPPPLSLQIFDEQELCLVDPTLGFMLPENQRNMLWVRGKDVARVFSIYYDSLWKDARRLKSGAIIYWPLLRELLDELRSQEPDESTLANSISDRIIRMSGAVVEEDPGPEATGSR